MKKTTLISSTLGLALLLSPVAPAFAEEGVPSGDDATSINTTNTIQIKIGERRNADQARLQEARRLASTTEHMRENREEKRASTSANHLEKKIEKKQEHAGEAIDKRIRSLQELSARIADMKLISADTRATITASLNAEIASLIALKAKIGSDTATSTIKSDASEITKAHRVYMLVEPKARIAASASRINAVVMQMQLLVTKLQARITAAQTDGINVSEATAALTDLSAKIADAKIQADAALAGTVNLQPDNGNEAVKASNRAALKEARAKLEIAAKDLVAARHDAATIYSVVKGKGGDR